MPLAWTLCFLSLLWATPSALAYGTAQYHTWLQFVLSRLLIPFVEPSSSLWFGPHSFFLFFFILKVFYGLLQVRPYMVMHNTTFGLKFKCQIWIKIVDSSCRT